MSKTEIKVDANLTKSIVKRNVFFHFINFQARESCHERWNKVVLAMDEMDTSAHECIPYHIYCIYVGELHSQGNLDSMLHFP